MSNQLFRFIQQLAPNLKKSSLYTRDDLIADVYLKATELGLTINNKEQLQKLVKAYSIQQYRVKYSRHSTANYTAEDLEQFCRHLLVNQVDQVKGVTLYDYLRQAYIELFEELSC